MRRFQPIHGVACPLFRNNIDTDQLIPKHFLTSSKRSGYADALFHGWRVRPDGSPDPEFPLNRPEWRGAKILLAAANFGCGSSREHAVWALRDYGIAAVLAISFADIFRSNCGNNGLLAATLPDRTMLRLVEMVTSDPSVPFDIELETQRIEVEDMQIDFAFDPVLKHRMLNGLDLIGLTLERETAITAHEMRRPEWLDRRFSA